MKPPYQLPIFENVSDRLFAEMQERDYRKSAWKRKKHYAPDSRYSIWERIGIIFGSFTFALALVCGVIINADKIDNPGTSTIITLTVIACIVAGYGLFKNRKA